MRCGITPIVTRWTVYDVLAYSYMLSRLHPLPEGRGFDGGAIIVLGSWFLVENSFWFLVLG